MAKISFLNRISITIDKRLKIYDMLDGYISSGISLKEALTSMREIEVGRKGKHSPVAKVYSEMLNRLSRGKRLGDLFEDIAPIDERMVLNAVSNNNLKNCFKATIDIATTGRMMNKTFYGAIIYPVVLFILAYIFLIIFSAFLMPSFSQTLTQTTDLSLLTNIGIELSNTVPIWGMTSFLTLIGLCIIIVILIPNWKGKLRVHADNLPPFNMYRLKIGCGFLVAIAGLIKSGAKLDHAIEQMIKNSKPYLAHRLGGILFHLKRGVNLGEAMAKTKLDFPSPDLVDRITVYAKGNNFASRIDILAKDFSAQGVESIKSQAAIARNIGLVLVVMVVLLILGVTFSVSNDLQQGVQSHSMH